MAAYGSDSWTQVWEALNNIGSPTSQLLYPGSHSSLQTGSSSSYHSPCSGVPHNEFENLSIFKTLVEDQIQIQSIEDLNAMMDISKSKGKKVVEKNHEASQTVEEEQGQ